MSDNAFHPMQAVFLVNAFDSGYLSFSDSLVVFHHSIKGFSICCSTVAIPD